MSVYHVYRRGSFGRACPALPGVRATSVNVEYHSVVFTTSSEEEAITYIANLTFDHHLYYIQEQPERRAREYRRRK